jgi:hypothetical protein
VELPQHALAAFRYHQCLVGEFTIAIEDIIDETLLRIQDKEDADDQVEDMYDTLCQDLAEGECLELPETQKMVTAMIDISNSLNDSMQYFYTPSGQLHYELDGWLNDSTLVLGKRLYGIMDDSKVVQHYIG